MFNRRVLAVGTLAIVAASAFAGPSAVGKWKGKLSFVAPPVPATATPEQKAQYNKMMASMKAMAFNLNLKADKTYTITITGGPQGKTHTENGKWSQTGSEVTMLGKQPNDKGQKAKLSADGKTMSVVLPPSAGKSSLVFSRIG